MEHIPATLQQPVKFCLFNIAWTYIASVITGNCSQVDRVWTFLPTLYTAYFAAYPLFDWAEPSIKARGVSPRAVLMLALQTVWMVRLSYNTWRRGLFNLADEDYRWEIFRKKVPSWLFQVFNFTFIAAAQNILLFLLGLPAHNALIREPQSLGTSDLLLAELALVVLALEFTSDNQQWSYQNFKRKGVINANEWIGAGLQWTEDDKQRGFITRGLWAYSRHPNCACEQTFWWIMAFFPVLGSYHLPKDVSSPWDIVWPLIPALALSGLFISSTIFTESISAPKYPEYKAYQSRVGMFWPFTTFLKGIYLWISGEKGNIEQQVWGRVKGKRSE
ncbi:hypothetical protein M422DRAFT_223234 [Sphaerobolus stellatus SS14]|nr:hypothetical protein M422DRAFT_223234 [Sphaerobolus stellatus SS14]